MAAERSQISLSGDIPVEHLQKRARWQRAQVEEDLADLRFGLRQTFDAKQVARKYFWQLVGSISLIGLIGGYSFAGVFSPKHDSPSHS